MQTKAPQLPCSKSFALERVRVLMGCFRRGEAEDPEVYVAAVSAVLASYPHEVAKRVTDPVNGLPSVSNWLPTIAEVKAACERQMKPLRDDEAREARYAETRKLLASPQPATAEQRERAVEHWNRIKGEVSGRVVKNAEAERIQAEKRLSELYREYHGTKPVEVTIGSELGKKIAAMKAEKERV